MAADIGLLRTALPYIRAYKNKVFVVKLSGQICEPGPALDNIMEQLSVLSHLGIKLVVVHGAGKQVTNLSEKLGIESTFVNGRRVTSAELLEVVKMSFAGTVNTDLIAAFRKHSIAAVGLTGIDGNMIQAKRRGAAPSGSNSSQALEEAVDFGYVGDIVNTNGDLLEYLICGNYIPVVCSLSADNAGQALNINADTVASSLAKNIGATKYCLLCTVDGVMTDLNNPASLCSCLDLHEAKQLIARGVISGGMLPKLETCIDALQGGVPRVHVVNGLAQDALLREIFTNEGCGTLIVKQREKGVEVSSQGLVAAGQ